MRGKSWANRDTSERRSLAWFCVSLGMLVVIGLIAGWTLRGMGEASRWVDHTREVIRQTDQLLAAVRGAESAQRGYLLTNDTSYLNAYETASAATPETLRRLKQLTVDNPEQQARLDTLQPLIAARLASLDDVIRARRESGAEAARQIILTGPGKGLMDQINEIGQQLENEEYRLLQERSQSRRQRLRMGFAATLTASLLALLALLSGLLDVRRTARQRDLAQQTRRESDATSRALFESAAQGIFMVDQSGRIVMANPATERLLGYPVNELLGQSIDILVPDASRGLHSQHRKSYFESPKNRPMGLGLDLQAKRKDGSEFFAEISLSFVDTARGRMAVAFLTDISKRKGDEQSIRQQKDELRLLAGRLMTAQDDERRRIARDLHDDLSQKLAYLAMDIGKLSGKPHAQAVRDDLRPLQMQAAEAAENVRRISHQLHPSILDDIGLEAALEQYCEEFQERSGIATHFESVNVPDAIPREIARSLYHIFQECLRNVSKHSKSEAVFVRLDVAEGHLRLTVKDEGIGLEETARQPQGNIGLVGMKERAHLVNGTVHIHSRTGEGTEVTVKVPLLNAA